MMPTAIECSRRAFLKGAAACLAAPSLLHAGCATEATVPPGGFISANNGTDGRSYLSRYDFATRMRWTQLLPWRGHGSAMHPTRAEVVHVARRPGPAFVVVDFETGAILATITSPAQRHFLGHAVYSPDGRYLYASENVFDDSLVPDFSPQDSVVGVYDAENGYQRVREFSSHGVGAHELIFYGDNLAIANGGIYTHPAADREKLNIDSMQPSLVVVDPRDGVLLAQHELSDPKLSIRHMAIGADGALAIGMQYEGDPESLVPLMAILRSGALEPLAAPDSIYRGLNQYVASVSIAGDTIVASSPRGNRVECWHSDGSYLGGLDASDVSGLGAHGEFIVASTGGGEIHLIDSETATPHSARKAASHRWDNHLQAFALG